MGNSLEHEKQDTFRVENLQSNHHKRQSLNREVCFYLVVKKQ